MNKKVLGVFGSLLAVAILTLPMSTVFAKNNPKFMAVSGDLIITPIGTAVPKLAGESGNLIIVITGNGATWTDGIEGTGTASGHFLIHKDGISTARNIHTLTDAEVDGKTGTLTIISSGSMMNGHWRILKGTGELANLHGQGTWAVVTPPLEYSYAGQVHFDPQP